jgi:hypothetical protein
VSARKQQDPRKCEAFVAKAKADPASVELTARDLGEQYTGVDAVRLSLRYAIPLLGAFGSPDWVPMEKKDTAIGPGPKGFFEIPISPWSLCTLVLVVNTLLLSFAAAFVTRRWLR